MKIRNGFVSNSSTTSFMIYGVTIEKGEEDLFDKFESVYLELCELHLDHYYPDYDSVVYFGRSLACIKDDQTFKQFKEETKKDVLDMLTRIMGKGYDTSSLRFGILEEAWRDG